MDSIAKQFVCRKDYNLRIQQQALSAAATDTKSSPAGTPSQAAACTRLLCRAGTTPGDFPTGFAIVAAYSPNPGLDSHGAANTYIHAAKTAFPEALAGADGGNIAGLGASAHPLLACTSAAEAAAARAAAAAAAAEAAAEAAAAELLGEEQLAAQTSERAKQAKAAKKARQQQRKQVNLCDMLCPTHCFGEFPYIAVICDRCALPHTCAVWHHAAAAAADFVRALGPQTPCCCMRAWKFRQSSAAS